MKTSLLILLGFTFCLNVKAQEDTLNVCILNRVDTIDVQRVTDLFDCNYLISTEKSHNKCRIKINDSLFTGRISYHILRIDDSFEIFDGEINNGLIIEGTVLRYSSEGKLILTGQYNENWKSGIWTTYYVTGEIESVMKFIKSADYPVIEWEYNKDGQVTYYNNEQKEMEERIKTTR
ncbi:MAG: hypothetical protein SGI87_07155 [Flavobacteriales bacterium]|nr:hypothetical protein [Flavobacteriales bacterium]